MNYEILVLDLDGTLTNSQKEITLPTLEALIDIQKRGKKVILASGRPTMGILPLAEQLCLSEYGGYVLSYNGAQIFSCRENKAIYSKTIPVDCHRPVVELAKKYASSGVDILTYSDTEILSGIKPNKYTVLEGQINKVSIQTFEDLPAQITFPIHKFLATGDAEIIDALKKDAVSHFRSYLNIYCSEPFFLEIVPTNIDKAHSLQRLLNNIGLTSNEMICCGDGYNDVTMIEVAGLGVAMANAQPVVLQKADYVTKSNDDNGILHVIDLFMR